jgi:hypothetical protein
MIKRFFLILLIFVFCHSARSQYIYRGQVFSSIRQEAITFGVVRLPTPAETGRHGKELALIDSLGYFTFSLKDTSNVRIVVDCVLAGSTMQRLFYTDTVIKIFIKRDCYEYNANRAKKDIQNNNIYLLCHLGYAAYKFSSADSNFMKKYGVTYYTFADMPIMGDCMWLYNTEIARYLDKKYGDVWRAEVRWNVPI